VRSPADRLWATLAAWFAAIRWITTVARPGERLAWRGFGCPIRGVLFASSRDARSLCPGV